MCIQRRDEREREGGERVKDGGLECEMMIEGERSEGEKEEEEHWKVSAPLLHH